MRIIQAISFAFLLIGAVACKENRIYEKNIDLPQHKWGIDSLLVFKFNVQDIASTYDIYYNIRNSINYGYYNLYITYYLEDDKGKVIDSQLQDITLMNANTGEPFGSGLGDIFSHQLLALKQYKFKKKGNYTLKIKHYMRDNPLTEIVSMGIKIEKSKK